MAETPAERGSNRMDQRRNELVWLIGSTISQDGAKEVLPGLFLSRSSVLSTSPGGILQPAFCFVAQGAKRAVLGEDVFHYDPGHYLIFTVDLPLTFQVEQATEDEPYFGMRLNLEPSIVATVMAEAAIKFRKGEAAAKAMSVNPVDINLMDAVVRLVRLVDTPADQKMLFPLIQKEIVYRLLSGGQGARLGHMIGQADTHRISKAIGYLRTHLDKPLSIDAVARDLGMSISGFHHHFKSVTAMSPLQYHKQIRLQEARRLMLAESLDAAAAGFQVGYEDPSYFSRDYKKQFGSPPQRDIAKLRSDMNS
jgi:AraC-like DNA-binding protein